MITVTPSAGSNGTISPSAPQTVAPGTQLTFTAAPNAGYEITAWLVNGHQISSGNTLTVALGNDGTVNVAFDFITSLTSTFQPFDLFAPTCESGECTGLQNFYLACNPYTPVPVGSYPFSEAFDTDYPMLCHYSDPQLLTMWIPGTTPATLEDSFTAAKLTNPTGLLGQKGQGDFPGSFASASLPDPFLVMSTTATQAITGITSTFQGGGIVLAWGSVPCATTFTSKQQLPFGDYYILLIPAAQLFTPGSPSPALFVPGALARYPNPFPASISGCLNLVDRDSNLISTPVFSLSSASALFIGIPTVGLPIRPVYDGCGRLTNTYGQPVVYYAKITIPLALNTFLQFNAIDALPDYVAMGVFQKCVPCSFMFPP